MSLRFFRALPMLALIAFVAPASVGSPVRPAGTTTITTCDWPTLQSALSKGGRIAFACSGTIDVGQTIDISGTVSLDATGQSVSLVPGASYPAFTRMFDVQSGANLTITEITVGNVSLAANAEDGQGIQGPDGAEGVSGPQTINRSGKPGQPGTAGGPGLSGTAGQPAEGAAMKIAPGAVVRITNSTFLSNTVVGGTGGGGGFGGDGGSGGWGGGGANPGDGGAVGGSGANGADGANGSGGGAAMGGSIYSAGRLTLINDLFGNDAAIGGNGGNGGNGGCSGLSGNGGLGNIGVSSTTAAAGGPGGAGGQAGDAGKRAGTGANAAPGGAALGGAIFNSGTLTAIGVKFPQDTATGGAGGYGGPGGCGGGGRPDEFSGYGGDGGGGGGGTTTSGPGGVGGSGASGSAGAPGGNAAAGGDALGGAVYNTGTLQLCSTSFRSDSATSGSGGGGGDGGAGGGGGDGAPGGFGAGTEAAPGTPGNGANGAAGGNGANAGSVAGGAVYSAGSLARAGLTLGQNQASSGQAGTAGAGGAGGPGGKGYNGAADGSSGGDGSKGRAGGKPVAGGANVVEGPPEAGAQAARRQSRRSSGACPEIVIQPTRPGPMESGLSWPTSPPNVGFVTQKEDGNFLDTCLSGCRNVLLTVEPAGGGAGLGDLKVKVGVSALAADVVNPDQGGGYLCEVASFASTHDGSCGNPITVTTDTQGSDEGRVYLRYFSPATYVPAGQSPPDARITASVDSCASTCSNSEGSALIQVAPHLIVQRLGVPLTWDQKQALIRWGHDDTSVNKTNLSTIDKTLKTVSLFFEHKGFKALAKAVADLAKGVKLFGTMADYAMLLWFDQTFGIVPDGLIHLGSTGTLVDEIVKYIKNPVANAVISGLAKLLFKSRTYTSQTIAMLKDYASGWLWTDETNHDTQIMNVKVYEASYCKDTTCRDSLTPLGGAHDNLFVTFSSKDFTQGTPYFKGYNVTEGYAANTWMAWECPGLENSHTHTNPCNGEG